MRCGSSPPTWGILDLHAAHAGERRFIPTYVGHTRAVNPVNIYCPVHPHIRGVYADCVPITVSVGGSSPPTWGIPGRGSRLLANVRFIPTYVGHTEKVAKILCSSSVHPHIRGAYANITNPAERQARFIPTYVGHIMSLFSSRESRAVHPHIRGAYRALGGATTPTRGSSPHTWGIRWCPARCRRCLRVHPHIRGAYASSSAWLHSAIGSSPHTWGIPFRYRKYGPVSRFIPTYVGHTQHLANHRRAYLVHPHIRGAYPRPRPTLSPPAGSSPHTWGIHPPFSGQTYF